MQTLSEFHPWLKEQIEQVRTLASRLGSVPGGSGGDLSILLPPNVQEVVSTTAPSGPELSFEELPRLKDLRQDGVPYYRAEALTVESLQGAGLPKLEGRAILCTRAGAFLDDLADAPESNLCIVSVGSEGRTFKIEYGYEQ